MWSIDTSRQTGATNSSSSRMALCCVETDRNPREYPQGARAKSLHTLLREPTRNAQINSQGLFCLLSHQPIRDTITAQEQKPQSGGNKNITPTTHGWCAVRVQLTITAEKFRREPILLRTGCTGTGNSRRSGAGAIIKILKINHQNPRSHITNTSLHCQKAVCSQSLPIRKDGAGTHPPVNNTKIQYNIDISEPVHWFLFPAFQQRQVLQIFEHLTHLN